MSLTKKNLAVRLSLLGAALATTIGVSAGAATASPARPSVTASVVGSYTSHDNLGNDETVTVKSNGAVAFQSGCTGIWVKSGSTIALDINANCSGSAWIFSGTVNSVGFSSKASPGHLADVFGGRTLGAWYAVRI